MANDSPDDRNWGLALIGIGLGLIAVIGVVLVARVVPADEQRDPLYREAQEEHRSIGPTSGLLDDGSKVGAVTFFDEHGVVCSVFGPPGERTEQLYCVPDTAEEVDAINWEVEPENDIDLTVMIVDGQSPHIAYEFDGPIPGHASNWFPIAKPAVVAVYVGPPWQSLDIDTGPPP